MTGLRSPRATRVRISAGKQGSPYVTLRLIARMRRFELFAVVYLRIFRRDIIKYAAIMIISRARVGR